MPAKALRAAAWSAAITAACLLVTEARSAEDEREQPKRHRIGALTFTPRIQLKNAGVVTNVFQTLQSPVRDDVAVVSPRVDGTLALSDRFRITGLGFLEENYFRRQGQERSTNFYGEGEALLDWGQLKLRGGGGGGQFTERLSIEIGDRLTHQEKRAHAGATWQLTRHFSTSVEGKDETFVYAPGVFRFGGNIKDALDRNTLVGTAQLRYGLTSMTTLLVAAEAQEDKFPSQPAFLPRNHLSYRYVGGFEFGERALVSGKLVAGIREFPGTLAQGVAPYTGPVVSADLTVPLWGVARLHGVGERDVQFAVNLVEVGPVAYRNSYILTRYAADVVADLPWNLSAYAGAGFEQAHFLLPYPFPDSSLLAERVDHGWTGTTGLLRRFGNTFKIGGHIAWVRRVSSLPLYSWEGLAYGLTAEVVP
jgi:hypothetical protein